MKYIKKELNYATISFSNSDNYYINDVCEYFNAESEYIVSYFRLNNYFEKADIVIYNDLNEFKNNVVKNSKYYKKVEDIPNYVCADGGDDKHISILSFDEYIKTENHNNCTIEDYKKVIMHEFVHFCHHKLNNTNMEWINEGLATNLSKQTEKYRNNKLNIPLKNYSDYCLAFEYIMNNYQKEYVLKLVSNIEIQKRETQKLWEEIKNIII